MSTDIRPMVRRLRIIDKNMNTRTLGSCMTPMQTKILDSTQADLDNIAWLKLCGPEML